MTTRKEYHVGQKKKNIVQLKRKLALRRARIKSNE
jgi:hypothetical protein